MRIGGSAEIRNSRIMLTLRRYGAKVSTRPSQGRNPGSTPGTATRPQYLRPLLLDCFFYVSSGPDVRQVTAPRNGERLGLLNSGCSLFAILKLADFSRVPERYTIRHSSSHALLFTWNEKELLRRVWRPWSCMATADDCSTSGAKCQVGVCWLPRVRRNAARAGGRYAARLAPAGAERCFFS